MIPIEAPTFPILGCRGPPESGGLGIVFCPCKSSSKNFYGAAEAFPGGFQWGYESGGRLRQWVGRTFWGEKWVAIDLKYDATRHLAISSQLNSMKEEDGAPKNKGFDLLPSGFPFVMVCILTGLHGMCVQNSWYDYILYLNFFNYRIVPPVFVLVRIYLQ